MSNILVVEDNIDAREIMARLLEKRGFNVSSASNALKAIDLIKANNFDVVVTDMVMENEQAGSLVLQAAKEKDESTEVIIITAYGSIQNAFDSSKKGAFDYLEKDAKDPYELLISKIEAAINLRKTAINLCETGVSLHKTDSNIDVFVSYAKPDFFSAKSLYNDLQKNQIEAWIDKERLLPGERWDYIIRQAIRKSRYFIALISENSVSRKGYFQKEVKQAIDILNEFPESDIFIIPVRLDESTPFQEVLKELHWVDIFKSWNNGLNRIIRLIKSTKNVGTNWEGKWKRVFSGQFNFATILISNVDNGFKFEISANSGSNTGEISGVANLISENDALFQKEGCNVKFELENDLLSITTDNCMHYGGIGVFFDGIYRNEENFQQINYPLIKNGIFTTISEEIKFSELVGNDYELFKNSMHLVGEGNDVDRLGAKVFYGSIRGLFTLAESIIMYTETGEFWAAAIDNDIVKYFTNSPQYICRLPKTLENWRERFLDKKVVFMNYNL